MNTNLLDYDTRWLLEQWARWARREPDLVRMRYRSIQPYTQKITRSSLRAPVISDDEAMAVDAALAHLGQRDKEAAQATALYFSCNNNLSQVARILGVTRSRADVLVNAGTAWVDACIFNRMFAIKPETVTT